MNSVAMDRPVKTKAQPSRPRPKRPPPMPQTAPADAPLTQTLPLFPDES